MTSVSPLTGRVPILWYLRGIPSTLDLPLLGVSSPSTAVVDYSTKVNCPTVSLLMQPKRGRNRGVWGNRLRSVSFRLTVRTLYVGGPQLKGRHVSSPTFSLSARTAVCRFTGHVSGTGTVTGSRSGPRDPTGGSSLSSFLSGVVSPEVGRP